MPDLSKQKCEACRVGAPKLSPQGIAELQKELSMDWKVVNDNEVKKLVRKFSFDNFADAKSFVDKVSELAEEHGHHPLITFSWGFVEIFWWTHKIGGLHKNDFVMAAKTDRINSV